MTQFNVITITLLIISMTFVHFVTEIVGLSILVDPMLSIDPTYFHFGLRGRKFVMCLFGQCPGLGHMHHYVIAGRTQEMARLLLKMSRCLAYSAQPAMIIRCISLPWLFSLML